MLYLGRKIFLDVENSYFLHLRVNFDYHFQATDRRIVCEILRLLLQPVLQLLVFSAAPPSAMISRLLQKIQSSHSPNLLIMSFTLQEGAVFLGGNSDLKCTNAFRNEDIVSNAWNGLLLLSHHDAWCSVAIGFHFCLVSILVSDVSSQNLVGTPYSRFLASLLSILQSYLD